jgi:hypothetical protein
MDESKTGLARKRRASKAPNLETLEGRRLMTAAPSQVGIREVTQKGYTELDVIGTNKGDTITINDNGTVAPGNISVNLPNGTTYTSKGGISVVKVQDGSGSDHVTYDLTGTLTSPQSVLINMGAGNNVFTGNITSDINTANGLDLEVYGGAGNDNMVVNQTGATLAGAFVPYFSGGSGNNTLTYNGTGTIAASASVSPEYGSSSGNDTINTNYSGQIDGNYMYNLTSKAGTGTDTINNNVFVGAGSTGSVGYSSTTPAAIEGGKGNDKIRFAIAADPSSTASIDAVVIPGSGKETITRTSNVQVQGETSKDKDVVLS